MSDSACVSLSLDGAQIGNARTHLELQRITSPRTVALDSTTIVRPDAAVEIRQVTTHRFPERGGEVTYAIPVRRPFGDTQDQLFRVSDVTVTESTGARLGVRKRLRDQGSDQDLEITVEPDPATLTPAGIATLTLSYQVTGAVHGDPSQGRLR